MLADLVHRRVDVGDADADVEEAAEWSSTVAPYPRRVTPKCMVRSMDQQLPILYFDHPFPEAYRDLVEGRAIAVGPDDAELATAHAVLGGCQAAVERRRVRARSDA